MRSSLRKRKPWIVALIVIIAAIMVLPLYDVINVVGQMREQQDAPSFDPKDYMNEIKGRVYNLEGFLEDNEPTPAILKELSSLYMNLSYFTDEEAEREENMERALELMEEAVEINPDDAESYLTLYDLYNQLGDFERAMEAASTGEYLVLQRLEEAPEDNENRLNYSRFLSRYRYDYDEAIEQLTVILDTEPDDSHIYQKAEMEKEQLISQREAQKEAALEAEMGEDDPGDSGGEIEVNIGEEPED